MLGIDSYTFDGVYFIIIQGSDYLLLGHILDGLRLMRRSSTNSRAKGNLCLSTALQILYGR